jgi:hypothetical protein
MISVGDKEYKPEYLSRLIQEDENKKVSQIFEDRDLLYNIMLNSNYNTIQKTCSSNKIAVTITNCDQFWKDKILKDMPEFKLKSLNYKIEYKNIYNSLMMAKNMMDVIGMLKNINALYLCINNKSIILDAYDFYWMDYKNTNCVIYFNIKNEYELCVEDVNENIVYSINLNKNECVNFFGKLFYHYPEISIEDCDDKAIVFDLRYIIETYHKIKDLDDFQLDVEEIRIKYWGKLLNI